MAAKSLHIQSLHHSGVVGVRLDGTRDTPWHLGWHSRHPLAPGMSALLSCNDYVTDTVIALTKCDVLQAVALLAHGLNDSWQAVMCCQERARRVGQRASALVPALQELERVLRVPGHGVELRTVQSLSCMLVLLAKVSLLLLQTLFNV
jgi:hypothetical protein